LVWKNTKALLNRRLQVDTQTGVIMRTLLLGACLAASTTAFANECNIEIEGHIELDENIIIIETEDGDHVRFTEDALWFNRQSIDLTTAQQSYVSDYFHGIQQGVPLTFDIAMDAIDIAGTGVTVAFGGLLGENAGEFLQLKRAHAL
jgi:hypothetical protein